MKYASVVAFFVLVALLPALAWAQPRKKASEEDFVKVKPAVGDPFPDLVVYDPDGKEVKTSSFRGHYTVLTFGCLT